MTRQAEEILDLARTFTRKRALPCTSCNKVRPCVGEVISQHVADAYVQDMKSAYLIGAIEALRVAGGCDASEAEEHGDCAGEDFVRATLEAELAFLKEGAG